MSKLDNICYSIYLHEERWVILLFMLHWLSQGHEQPSSSIVPHILGLGYEVGSLLCFTLTMIPFNVPHKVAQNAIYLLAFEENFPTVSSHEALLPDICTMESEDQQ